CDEDQRGRAAEDGLARRNRPRRAPTLERKLGADNEVGRRARPRQAARDGRARAAPTRWTRSAPPEQERDTCDDHEGRDRSRTEHSNVGLPPTVQLEHVPDADRKSTREPVRDNDGEQRAAECDWQYPQQRD